ncbi:MAG: hypothetical protein LAT82_05275 [Nanoarchaeota archaeon]|nr:hypothetical protein [Nanoarchaeota archaeon]
MRFKKSFRNRNGSTLLDVNFKKGYATIYNRFGSNGIGFSTGWRGNRFHFKKNRIGGSVNTETGMFKLKKYI